MSPVKNITSALYMFGKYIQMNTLQFQLKKHIVFINHLRPMFLTTN